MSYRLTLALSHELPEDRVRRLARAKPDATQRDAAYDALHFNHAHVFLEEGDMWQGYGFGPSIDRKGETVKITKPGTLLDEIRASLSKTYAGEVHGTSFDPLHAFASFLISKEAFDAARSYAEQTKDAPPPFQIHRFNCAVFASEVAKHAGVDLAKLAGLPDDIREPYDMALAFQNLTQQAAPQGGLAWASDKVKIVFGDPLFAPPETKITLSPNDADALNLGFSYLASALQAPDFPAYMEAVQNGMNRLKPLAEQGVPKAAFAVGTFLHRMALTHLNNPAMSQEERLTNAFQYFGKAADYYEKAAGMIDNLHDRSPARAQNSLAELGELGVLGDGTKDFKRIFSLRLQAAEAGLADAQISLAEMYFDSPHVETSVPKAAYWMKQAWRGKDQLFPDAQQKVARELQIIMKHLGAAPTPAAPGTPRRGANPSEIHND